MNNDNAMLTCPRCGSTDVIVEAVQAFFVNTNEHYCHATKTHDGYAKTRCLDCEWTGRRDALRAASGRAGGDAQQHTYKALQAVPIPRETWVIDWPTTQPSLDEAGGEG